MIKPFYSTSRDPAVLPQQEALFHLANGYLGLRGYFAEHEGTYGSDAKSIRGMYLNGFYERVTLSYPEAHIGFPREGERMVALPDARKLDLFLDGKRISPMSQQAASFERALDPEGGQRWHGYDVRTAEDSVSVEIREMLLFDPKEVFLQRVILSAGEKTVRVTIRASIDTAVENATGGADPRLAAAADALLAGIETDVDGYVMTLSAATPRSGLTAAMASVFTLEGASANPSVEKDVPAVTFEFDLAAGNDVILTRYTAVTDTRRHTDPAGKAKALATAAYIDGYDVLAERQRQYLATFWHTHRLQIGGDDETSRALDFAVFTLLQSAPDDGLTLIPAKGLSGEGYEGHYFWDFEIYLFPFYLWTWPERARRLLDYRLHTLPAAIENARVLGYDKGAQYAWRTITGPECSGYFPSGSAQVHINADIAHAFQSYWLVSGDLAYMAEGGADVLIETARTWIELGGWRDGRFMLFGVTGPDEYTCLVDNNYFTNRSAQANLLAAVRIADALDAAALAAYRSRTGVTDAELKSFADAAAAMYLPHDAAMGIDAQDDGFLQRPEWDFEHTPADKFPLLLHFHPSKLYRYQVLKQPDTTLAHLLYESDLRSETVRRSRHYYEARTTHDSSLSPCVYGITAARDGEMQKAMRYFAMTRDTDWRNLQGNTADGLHLGNLGGTWLFAVQGLAGLSFSQDTVSFDPRLPQHWTSMTFRIVLRGHTLEIRIGRLGSTFVWHGDAPLDMQYRGRRIRLHSGENHIRHHLGIIFDLDGVLCHTDHFHYLAWKEIADKEGIPFSETDNRRLRGVSRQESLDIILENAGRVYSETEKAALAEQKNTRYREMLATMKASDIDPKHRAQLARLGQSYALAIGSSSRNAGYIIERLGLGECFPVIADGRDITHSKPHPEVFLLAAARLGLNAADCLVIEDAAAGLEAASAGRFTAVGFGEAAGHELAELSFPDLDALLAWFETDEKEHSHG